jgi:hypothetical protein
MESTMSAGLEGSVWLMSSQLGLEFNAVKTKANPATSESLQLIWIV